VNGLSGRRALVTGGATGFGFEIASRLRADGARVGILDVAADRLTSARASLGEDVLGLVADVRDRAAVASAVAECVESFGGLDTLIHSAGVIHIKPLTQVTEDDWDLVLDVNLKGAFLCAQAAAPALRASRRGRIVLIGSDASRRGVSGLQAYCASKFGVLGLTESLAAELAPDGVTVNSVCPVGCPTTDMGKVVLKWKIKTSHRSPEAIVAGAASLNPIGRNATEADIAHAVLHLISDSASFMTGVALDVDGGVHLGIMPGV
jgi:NAD(P)-dependent dehydrogenase (short-subunit alcohol dehydrogenase family)